MSFCTIQWFANSIKKAVQTNVILPNAGRGPFPVFYLLHGMSDDYSIWQRRTRIEVYVVNRPVIVVMPDGFRGRYTNNNQGPAYFDYMTQDLVEMVERTFPAKTSRPGRCVGGLSMGGYGALRLALGRPDMYASVNSHSGSVLGASMKLNPAKDADRIRTFGKDPRKTDHDLIELARRAKKAGRLPKILIDCGVDDSLIEQNRKYVAELNKMEIDHTYHEFPGAHTWDYWDLHIREALDFHGKAIGF